MAPSTGCTNFINLQINTAMQEGDKYTFSNFIEEQKKIYFCVLYPSCIAPQLRSVFFHTLLNFGT